MPNAPGDGLPRHRSSDDDRRRWVLPGAALGEVPEKRRRQRRLSYLAPALIENVALPMKGMRQG